MRERNPVFETLRTIVYPVTDLASAKAWWTALLGAPPYFDEPFYVGYDVNGNEVGLVPGAPEDSPTTYWRVRDAAAAYQTLLVHGATEHETPHEVGGGIVTASARDASGNLIGMISLPGE